MTEEHEGMYALLLTAEDPQGAASLSGSRSVVVEGETGREVSVFGTRFLIEQTESSG